MEGDIADRFVTVEYKTYASRSVRREIRRRCDVTCRVYNQLLDNALTALAEDGHVPDRYGMQTMITQMRAEDALIRSVKVDTLRDASDRLTRAFNRCGSKSARDGKPHSPRRMTPSRYRSVPLPVASFKIDDEHIVLDGEMRMRYRNRHRPKGGEPVAVRAILRDDDLFINITYSIKPEHHLFRGGFDMDADGFEGYDFGLVDIITDTHGGKIQAPDFYARREKDIARLQRQIAALEEGSPKRRKKERQLGRIFEEIRRKRDGFLEHLADDMLDGKSVVAIEDLKVRKMIEKGDNTVPRRKRYTEAALGSLTQKLEHKARKSDVLVLKVNPANTTRTCSRCGHVGGHIPLTTRMFRCPECGLEMDRDQNAARNILGSGMGTLRSSAEPSG